MRVLVEDVRSQMKRATIEFIPVDNIYDKTMNLKWSGGHYEPRWMKMIVCLQLFKGGKKIKKEKSYGRKKNWNKKKRNKKRNKNKKECYH